MNLTTRTFFFWCSTNTHVLFSCVFEDEDTSGNIIGGERQGIVLQSFRKDAYMRYKHCILKLESSNRAMLGTVHVTAVSFYSKEFIVGTNMNL
jgi:hypothetical protein